MTQNETRQPKKNYIWTITKCSKIKLKQTLSNMNQEPHTLNASWDRTGNEKVHVGSCCSARKRCMLLLCTYPLHVNESIVSAAALCRNQLDDGGFHPISCTRTKCSTCGRGWAWTCTTWPSYNNSCFPWINVWLRCSQEVQCLYKNHPRFNFWW